MPNAPRPLNLGHDQRHTLERVLAMLEQLRSGNLSAHASTVYLNMLVEDVRSVLREARR